MAAEDMLYIHRLVEDQEIIVGRVRTDWQTEFMVDENRIISLRNQFSDWYSYGHIDDLISELQAMKDVDPPRFSIADLEKSDDFGNDYLKIC